MLIQLVEMTSLSRPNSFEGETMTKLRTLASSFIIILTLSVAAFAGDISTPPCAPGDISTPPCTGAPSLSDDPTRSEVTQTPSAAEIVVIETITEAALGAFLSVF